MAGSDTRMRLTSTGRGDSSMGTQFIAAQAVLLASVVMAAAPPSAPITRTKRSGGSQDAAGLRQSLLELNELTGAGPMRGRLKEMIDERPDDVKNLLAVAFEMAKK